MVIAEERQALRQTFVDHWSQLRAQAQKIVGSHENAEDVTQEVYLKLTSLSEAFTIHQPLAYCFQVVRNMAIDYRRRQMLESKLFAADEEGVRVPSARGTPERIAMGRQNIGVVAKVLDQLPQRTRRVFEMYRLEGLTQREIGAQLGVSAALVNSLIREATDALMHCRHLLAVA